MGKWFKFTVKWTIISILLKIGFGLSGAVLLSSSKEDTKKYESLEAVNTQILSYAQDNGEKGIAVLKIHMDTCLRKHTNDKRPNLNYPDFYFNGLVDVFAQNLQSKGGGIKAMASAEFFRIDTRDDIRLRTKEIAKKERMAIKRDLIKMQTTLTNMRFCLAGKLETKPVQNGQRLASNNLSELR